MLTGDILPSSGTASLSGYDILKEQNDVRRHLGYCPQFDALPDDLTGREILDLFARIKLIPSDVIPEYVEYLIQKLGFQSGIADRPAKGYSGGNKRKLCVGLALTGNPAVVFLDEPSTGMDPKSKRFMWDVLSSSMQGRCVILTTHSMDECEALCHRIGVMVGGRLRCLGTAQRLKQLYGDAYQLDCNVSAGPVQEQFMQWLAKTFPQATLIERHGDSLKFRIPKSTAQTVTMTTRPSTNKVTISILFRHMENNKRLLHIKEYSVSESTLEQIFISMAKTQNEEKTIIEGIM